MNASGDPAGGGRSSAAPETSGRAAVLLDRDGTLVEEREYACTPADIVPLPGAGEALVRLGALGYLRIVLTNQSAVARGMIDEERLADLHEVLRARLAQTGGRLDAIYYCPHHPDGTAAAYAMRCRCRKPGLGLLEVARHEHGLDLRRCCAVGDSARDLFLDEPGLGARVLVETGHPLDARTRAAADAVVPDLVAATEWIAAWTRRSRGTAPPSAAEGSGDLAHDRGPDEPREPARDLREDLAR